METILPLLAFVVAATVTPGPNNLMVLVSGANWGLARTLPHIAGIAFGFPAMIIAVGLGLGVVFETMPGLEVVLKYVAFAYLLWLAWRMAQAGRPETWPHSPETSQFF
jgi:threonine/homoserine/homoserine lactone efflux protein